MHWTNALDQMIRAYKNVPHRYGSILASEIFQTGVLVSDTDFRQFEAYANLTGLDVALIQNSYLYHTRKDDVENLQPGTLTNMGQNLIAMLQQLTAANVELKGEFGEKMPVFFSALGGQVYFVFTPQRALQIYAAVSLVLAAITIERTKSRQVGLLLTSVLASIGSLLGGLLTANIVAAIMDAVKPVSWFRK